MSMTDATHCSGTSLVYVENSTRRTSTNAITARATETSAVAGDHERPKMGVLTPLIRATISENFTVLSLALQRRCHGSPFESVTSSGCLADRRSVRALRPRCCARRIAVPARRGPARRSYVPIADPNAHAGWCVVAVAVDDHSDEFAVPKLPGRRADPVWSRDRGATLLHR